MTDTLECSSCGARDSAENDNGEMYCSWCNYRLYPPEDRHDHQTRAALRRKPKTPSFKVNWEK